MITKEISISLKLVREKLHRNLVALIQFPDEQETMKALRILEENNRFLGAYNDYCYGIEFIGDLELLYENSIIYKVVDIHFRYSALRGKVTWKGL